MARLADPVSYANFEDVKTSHLDIDWEIDWDERIISGSVTHKVLALKDGVTEIVFDTHCLDLRKIYVNEKEVQAELKESRFKGHIGRPLHIPFSQPLKAKDEASIKIEYATTKDCTALGWLEANQTPSKRTPFLFSQCQAIQARSLLPCQDAPSVKMTYSAKALSKLPVLFSALRVSPPLSDPPVYGAPTLYIYDQPVPVSSYLIGIAAGTLAHASLSHRTGIWADPEVLESARYEFEQVEEFLATGEKLAGPYRWGRYDVVVMPPSFPAGGMENACLTFVHPSTITGDRSCVDVIAHEASHSWFGNDVTNRTWDHFWLNEGWTSYLERVIMGQIEGPAVRGLYYEMYSDSLRQELAKFSNEPRYQRLLIPFPDGTDPNEATSRIPYDKGSMFLYHLEQTVDGLDNFLPYMRDYVKTFRGKTVTTSEWKNHLFQYFGENHGDQMVKKLDTVAWDAWLNGEGLELPVKLKFDDTLSNQTRELAQKWKETYDHPEKHKFTKKDIESFNPNQTTTFLRILEAYERPMPKEVVLKLDDAFGFSKSPSCEIRLPWYQIAIRSGLSKHEAADWVKDKGRFKYSAPIFKALYDVDPEFGTQTWKECRFFFHPLAKKIIDRELNFTTLT